MDQVVTGRQIAAARALLGINQPELAALARLSVTTLKRMEGSDGPAAGLVNNVAAVKGALESAGIEFLNHGQPGVRLTAAKMCANILLELAESADPATAIEDVKSQINLFAIQQSVSKKEAAHQVMLLYRDDPRATSKVGDAIFKHLEKTLLGQI